VLFAAAVFVRDQYAAYHRGSITRVDGCLVLCRVDVQACPQKEEA
jgi:hypothetical protein